MIKIKSIVILIALMLVLMTSTRSYAQGDSYINMNNNWVTGPPPYDIYSMYHDPNLSPNSPELNLSEFECKDLSSCFGNKSGLHSTSTKHPLRSATWNATGKIKDVTSPNSSMYEIVLTNRNKSEPLNVSGWEIVTTSMHGSEKNLSLSDDTMILPAGSLIVNSPLADEPISTIILRDSTGSIIGMDSTIPVSIRWQKAKRKWI